MKQHPPNEAKTIFLTGGNGVVGRALVRELGTDPIIYLQYSSRIEQPNARAVSGDITRDRLGLSRSDYDKLLGSVDVVVHCAAMTKLHEAGETTLATNVEGTRNVVAFAERAGAPLIHLSTAFVSDRVVGRGSAGKTSYRDSKRMGEDLVKECRVPWTIVRPSVVVGDTADGAISQFQGLHFMVACFLKGLIPVIPATPSSICDFVPRDLVAQTVAAIVRERAFGGEYWITAGSRAMTVPRMLELSAAFAAKRGEPVADPRLIDPDSVVRLFLPVFMPTLPKRERQKFERLFEIARYYDLDGPFPSSLPELERRGWLKAPDSFEALFLRNLEFWADSTGFGERTSQKTVERALDIA